MKSVKLLTIPVGRFARPPVRVSALPVLPAVHDAEPVIAAVLLPAESLSVVPDVSSALYQATGWTT